MNAPGTPKGNGPPRRPEVRKVVRRQRDVAGDPSTEEQRAGFRGWHERGYVPHRDEPGLMQFVTFRLADRFPLELRDEWERVLKIEDDRQRRIELESWLDLGKGDCWLKDERVAAVRSMRENPVKAGLVKTWKDWAWTYVRDDA